jgi:hypothetical protein
MRHHYRTTVPQRLNTEVKTEIIKNILKKYPKLNLTQLGPNFKYEIFY